MYICMFTCIDIHVQTHTDTLTLVRYLLVVPPGASKGSAALHCSYRLGFPEDRVMVAGDGENDVPLFEVHPSWIRYTVFALAFVPRACADGVVMSHKMIAL